MEPESNSARKKRLAREHNERYEQRLVEAMNLEEQRKLLHDATGIPVETEETIKDSSTTRRSDAQMMMLIAGALTAGSSRKKYN